MNTRIYQINAEKDTQNLIYESYDRTTNLTQSKLIDFNNLYELAWEGELQTDDLEEIFCLFQLSSSCPCDYTGRSMSVSDVVFIEGTNAVEQGYYFCDRVGFKKVEVINVPDPMDSPFNLNVVICEPGKEAYIKKIASNLTSMQTVVGGYIEVYYPFDNQPNICIICNDSGKISNMMPCRAIYDENGEIKDVIFGTFFIADGSTESISGLTSDDAAKYAELFKAPETLVYSKGKISMEKNSRNLSSDQQLRKDV